MLSRLNKTKYKLVEIEELIWVDVSARRTQSLRSCPALLVLRGRDLRRMTGETLAIHSSMSSTCSPISISISAAASVASCSAFGNFTMYFAASRSVTSGFRYRKLKLSTLKAASFFR